MANVLAAREITKTFGTRTLFSEVSLVLEDRERLALIGPNGSGKSTLLKIIAGAQSTDGGVVSLRKGARVAYVAQSDNFPEGSTILSAVIADLNAALKAGQAPHVHDDHEIELAAEMTLRRAGFEDLEKPTSVLSGGQRKRLSITRALAREPDALLLDEPTNHLDVDGIEWMEGLLRTCGAASIFVTHDRMLLENLPSRIVELSRTYPRGTFAVAGGYSEFLRRKQEFLDGQAQQEKSLANQVREDLRWLSRGAQARRTKSKGRITASHERIDELAQLRSRNAPAKAAGIDFTATGRQTVKLLSARALTKAYGDRKLFTDVDVLLTPGQVLGLMGPNGCGKSTLIKVLTGEIPADPPTPEAVRAAKEAVNVPIGTPAPGTIIRADKLSTITFSQHRTELDPGMTLQDTLSPHADSVIYRGRPMHVKSWASRFLFTAEQLKQPIRALSGGEQARIHIARLMLEAADILVLDEPTNDLDIASLEVLENSIEEFPGAVILVTHDRAMLADLATQILAFDGRGGAQYFTDYEQWEEWHELQKKRGSRDSRGGASEPSAPPAPAPKAAPKRKLTYNEQRELAGMEAAIEKAETSVRELESQMNDPAVIADRKKFDDACKRMGEAQARVATLYARWSALDS
jgi:ATP-binding cassette subfamily F protein uup